MSPVSATHKYTFQVLQGIARHFMKNLESILADSDLIDRTLVTTIQAE
jgi:hypothetical protein